MKTKDLNLRVRSIDDARRSADCVASTDAVDSYGESVDQSSWRLDRYKKNPVVLFAHQSGELPVGQCSDIRVENGQLVARIVFATAAANPKAEQVWQLVRDKTLRAVSVGFLPHTTRSEVRDGQDVTVLADCELYEISVVPLPANPGALFRGFGAGRTVARAADGHRTDLGAMLDEVIPLSDSDARFLDDVEHDHALQHARTASAARRRQDARTAIDAAKRRAEGAPANGPSVTRDVGAIYAEPAAEKNDNGPTLGELYAESFQDDETLEPGDLE